MIIDVIEKMNEIAKVGNEFDSIFTMDVAWFIFICLNDFVCHLYTIILWKDCDSYDPTLYYYLLALDLYSFLILFLPPAILYSKVSG